MLSDGPPGTTTPPADRPLHVRRRLLWLSAGLGCYAASLLLSRVPGLTEAAYGTTTGPVLARVLSHLTGVVPFSLSELFVVAVISRQLFGATRGVMEIRARQRTWKNAALAGILRLAQDTGVLIALFYVLWGFNYSRAPLHEKLSWPQPTDLTAEELAGLSQQAVAAANDAYLELHGVNDLGKPTQPTQSQRALQHALMLGWATAREELGLSTIGGRFGRAKTPFLTPWYEWTGTAGFYFPYTAEANLRAGIPAVDHPKMLSHELAHQRGVARESEANFWGFLAAARSTEPWARYSAFVFAQRQLLAVLTRQDPERAVEVARTRLPGVQRDIEDSRDYWVSFRGAGTELGRSVNNAYLRSNRVEGGIRNYSMASALLIAYARSRGGRLGAN
ncbi:MAG: DUF3810 domain-containing protein [Gemmatimonadota bacterium]|nr:MAG: DUF3810 domain-containing protein [Gemmatimonadota bacterium]